MWRSEVRELDGNKLFGAAVGAMIGVPQKPVPQASPTIHAGTRRLGTCKAETRRLFRGRDIRSLPLGVNMSPGARAVPSVRAGNSCTNVMWSAMSSSQVTLTGQYMAGTASGGDCPASKGYVCAQSGTKSGTCGLE